jgi:hypothetical protein
MKCGRAYETTTTLTSTLRAEARAGSQQDATEPTEFFFFI